VQGFVFENKVVGGAVPRQFVPAMQAGVRDALTRGVLGEQPIVDIRWLLSMARPTRWIHPKGRLRTAASMALRKAVSLAGPILLEPIMRVEVMAPEEYTGEVLGDLSTRAASVTGIESNNGSGQAIHADVPLAAMFGYATSLRSRTQGRGSFVMEFDHYAPISPEVIKERQKVS
jgi:elongation factor G